MGQGMTIGVAACAYCGAAYSLAEPHRCHGALDTARATAEANARGEGFKADAGKPDWTIFPFDGAEPIVRVLEVGAKKYARDNWRKVPGAVDRYRAAALRHLAADALGERNDPETGLPHLAHAGCCLLFALALRRGDAVEQAEAERRDVAGKDPEAPA